MWTGLKEVASNAAADAVSLLPLSNCGGTARTLFPHVPAAWAADDSGAHSVDGADGAMPCSRASGPSRQRAVGSGRGVGLCRRASGGGFGARKSAQDQAEPISISRDVARYGARSR
ncbi:hypothetical protein CC85DRAFT_29937 [Cutaneotrichosporon oleaginosum]|uniref:Uncharacterized protein n=1 Tax=Cutaneotrichosporon oleaginosum TaxID=879819 RepID=A0A0J1B8H5_9TREE|nr:uncharacterized protein CC85DRAFT_29937 [Cutaneotrichosporon oleaginosum]KLT44079.1 hypothetical protein CC85DRAFT_29937 [Cutaneotrichosporon oleaginosum]TXT09465.1 hypothetical protein COLE_03399 [Cutaneotrichosporon oleaginosum]